MTPVDAVRILESDFKDVTADDKTVSQEDIMFLDKLKEGIRKNAQGHYEMPLHLSSDHTCLTTENLRSSDFII